MSIQPQKARNPILGAYEESGPLLPMCRVAACVKAREDKQGIVVVDHEKQRVGEAAQYGAANVLVDNRKLPGAAADALDKSVNRLAEPSP